MYGTLLATSYILIYFFLGSGGSGAYPSMHWARRRKTPWTHQQFRPNLHVVAVTHSLVFRSYFHFAHFEIFSSLFAAEHTSRLNWIMI